MILANGYVRFVAAVKNVECQALKDMSTILAAFCPASALSQARAYD